MVESFFEQPSSTPLTRSPLATTTSTRTASRSTGRQSTADAAPS
jgi:hypothetical protein